MIHLNSLSNRVFLAWFDVYTKCVLCLCDRRRKSRLNMHITRNDFRYPLLLRSSVIFEVNVILFWARFLFIQENLFPICDYESSERFVFFESIRISSVVFFVFSFYLLGFRQSRYTHVCIRITTWINACRYSFSHLLKTLFHIVI